MSQHGETDCPDNARHASPEFSQGPEKSHATDGADTAPTPPPARWVTTAPPGCGRATLLDRFRKAVRRILRRAESAPELYIFGKHPAWRDFIDVSLLPPTPRAFRSFHRRLRPGVAAACAAAGGMRLMLWRHGATSAVLLVAPSRDAGDAELGTFRRSPLFLGLTARARPADLVRFAAPRLERLAASLQAEARTREEFADVVRAFQQDIGAEALPPPGPGRDTGFSDDPERPAVGGGPADLANCHSRSRRIRHATVVGRAGGRVRRDSDASRAAGAQDASPARPDRERLAARPTRARAVGTSPAARALDWAQTLRACAPSVDYLVVATAESRFVSLILGPRAPSAAQLVVEAVREGGGQDVSELQG